LAEVRRKLHPLDGEYVKEIGKCIGLNLQKVAESIKVVEWENYLLIK
jgi:hypothetical protein